MLRARVCLLTLILVVLAGASFAKDEPAMVMFWPSQDNATLKLSFSRFRNVASYEGKMTLVSDVVVQNLSDKPMAQASFSVSLLDKDHVRVGSGLLVFTEVNPGESVKVLFQCESVGAPATLSIGAKNNGGVPASLRTIPLQVISVPSGASLKVDGKDQGFTPTTVSLTVGSHNFELQKDGYALTTSPVDVAGDERAGSIKINLGGLPNDLIQLRDGSSVTGDVMSLTLDSVTVHTDGKDQKFDRNQVSKIFLVERQTTHTVTAPEAPSKTTPPTPQSVTPHQ